MNGFMKCTCNGRIILPSILMTVIYHSVIFVVIERDLIYLLLVKCDQWPTKTSLNHMNFSKNILLNWSQTYLKIKLFRVLQSDISGAQDYETHE